MKPTKQLGDLDELVLLAIARLQEDAYGVSIRKRVEEATNRPASIGAIYAALERLEDQGFISSRQGEPTAERGGRAKRYFKVEGAGIAALREADEIRAKMREGANLGWLPQGGVA